MTLIIIRTQPSPTPTTKTNRNAAVVTPRRTKSEEQLAALRLSIQQYYFTLKFDFHHNLNLT